MRQNSNFSTLDALSRQFFQIFGAITFQLVYHILTTTNKIILIFRFILTMAPENVEMDSISEQEVNRHVTPTSIWDDESISVQDRVTKRMKKVDC